MFNGTDVMIGMVEDKHHWWLYYIHKETRAIFIYDSLNYSVTNGRHSDILPQLLIYFPNYTIHHTTSTVPPKQDDGFSCGLFLMKYAKDLISTDRVDRNTWVTTKSFSIDAFRAEVIRYIKEKNNY